jgi:uncharacterized membrane protein YfcA
MVERRILRTLWVISILVMATILLLVTFYRELLFDINLSAGPVVFLSLAVMAFFAEYVDSSLGMGYGTTLTPILLLLGYEPLEIVPAIIFSEFLTGTLAGFLHHKIGNVDFRKGTRSRKISLVLFFCAIVGTVGAVILAVSLPKMIVKLYIGVMIFAMGLLMLLSSSSRIRFSWPRITFIGALAAFNKGISGGGFGPLLTGGQILSGVSEKNAVGITSLVEGMVCLVGFILYQIFHGGLNVMIATALVSGAILSTPMATRTVRVLPDRILRRAMGYTTLVLGTLTLLKLM